MGSKYKRPEFLSKEDMRKEMLAVASGLRRACSEQTSHETLREWALDAAEVLEVVGSHPTLQERLVWAIVGSLAAYGLLTFLAQFSN
jgi:hypothetical protein